MLDAYDAIKGAMKIKGTNKKIEFLKNNMTPELRQTIEYAVSPYIVFGVKQYTLNEPLNTNTVADEKWVIMLHLLQRLKSTQLTGNNALDAIKEISIHLNKKQQFLLQCILDKDLGCGIGIKNANLVCPGLIPVFSVQLANSTPEKIEFPCIAEIKRNGVRNIAIVSNGQVTHYSRNGKEQPWFSFLNQELLMLAGELSLVFDGEIYGLHKDHRISYKMAQSAKVKNKEVDTTQLIYTLFDMIPLGAWTRKSDTLKQVERSTRLRNMLRDHYHNRNVKTNQVLFSKQKAIHDKQELDAYFAKVVKNGHEGLIIKDPAGTYQFKRSNNWQKLKCSEDEEFKIVDVLEGKKAMAGMVGSVVVETKGGTSNCGMKGFSHEELKEMWKQRKKMIGKMAKIQFMNYTPDGNLYLPKFLHIRGKHD